MIRWGDLGLCLDNQVPIAISRRLLWMELAQVEHTHAPSAGRCNVDMGEDAICGQVFDSGVSKVKLLGAQRLQQLLTECQDR